MQIDTNDVGGVRPPPESFELSLPVVVIGAGSCGLSAALAVRDAGVDVLVLERDATPLGSSAMSTGLIPAAGTPEQAAEGIEDSPAQFAADIMAKTKGGADPVIAIRLADESAETVAWLRDRHGVPLTLVDGFLYPGHAFRRMYGTPNRAGGELMGALQAAAEAAGVDLLTQACVTAVYAGADGMIKGVQITRPDGATDDIAARP